MSARWQLHDRLERGSIPVLALPLTEVRLKLDANYPWVLMMPRVAGASDLTDLSGEDQLALMGEIGEVSGALKAETRCDRLNIAMIGNIVPQLHVHLVARFESDGAWPDPVWGKLPKRAYPEGEADALASRLAARIRPRN